MLNDDDGIPHVAQLFERTDETDIIALVKTDAGLIKNVKDIDQLRTYLRCQPDALALTAGKSHCGSVE